MSCSIIPFDEIGCLNINVVAGFKKLIPMSFGIEVGIVTTPIDLSFYDDIILNVYNVSGTSLVPALKKQFTNGITLPTNFQLQIQFGAETSTLKGEYYYNLEFVKAGQESIFYVQGHIVIKDKKDFVKKNITTNSITSSI